MPIDRETWSGPFAALPRLPCSECKYGHLIQASDEVFKGEETKTSRVHGVATELRPEWTEHRFAVLIRCSEKACREPHAIMGRREGYQDCVPDNEGDYWRARLHIDGILPPPMPIYIPADVPPRIADPIKVAAKLYWNNPASAGNALRQAVERFLDFKGVKASEPRKNPKPNQERALLSIERRLADYRDRLKGDATLLSAVRHLGNVGSHDGALEQEDVLLAFEMIEKVLDDQFVGTQERLDNAAALIERSRGRARSIK